MWLLAPWEPKRGCGVEVVAPTLIASQLPADKIGFACRGANALSIEAWVRPAAVDQAGPARIITLSADNNSADFSLGQDALLAEARVRNLASEIVAPRQDTCKG